jgi:hypothetical protein
MGRLLPRRRGSRAAPLFVDSIPYLPTPTAAEPQLTAVDLGCGDGAETLEPLRRGWMLPFGGPKHWHVFHVIARKVA